MGRHGMHVCRDCTEEPLSWEESMMMRPVYFSRLLAHLCEKCDAFEGRQCGMNSALLRTEGRLACVGWQRCAKCAWVCWLCCGKSALLCAGQRHCVPGALLWEWWQCNVQGALLHKDCTVVGRVAPMCEKWHRFVNAVLC